MKSLRERVSLAEQNHSRWITVETAEVRALLGNDTQYNRDEVKKLERQLEDEGNNRFKRYDLLKLKSKLDPL